LIWRINSKIKNLAETFFKKIMKGVTAKLNITALHSNLSDLKKVDFCLEMNYLSNKKNRLS
jgi:hypothetical protein